eukprot:GFYU01021838.1.p1 GENE.GFYU01021838.1~~GFYU01021838.1.p1  ORF type:complete len:646 (-),score=108.97 GFYU01021838.1:67-2004(-)
MDTSCSSSLSTSAPTQRVGVQYPLQLDANCPEARYKPVTKLHGGVQGWTYIVNSVESEEKYVMKRTNSSGMDQSEKDAALNEIRILASFDHINIIKYKESYYERSGVLCMVMEYADGGDIYNLMKERRDAGTFLSEEEICMYFIQIARALDYVHSSKTLHRDLKPKNIFITKEGCIKLGDFGLSKTTENAGDLTKTLLGTPYYLSPEIALAQEYDLRSDLWSLGIVLYELIELVRPFDGRFHEVMVKIVEGKHRPFEREGLDELKELVTLLLKTDRAERLTTKEVLQHPYIQRMSSCVPENFTPRVGPMRRSSSIVPVGVDPEVYRKERLKMKKQQQKLNRQRAISTGSYNNSPLQSPLNSPFTSDTESPQGRRHTLVGSAATARRGMQSVSLASSIAHATRRNSSLGHEHSASSPISPSTSPLKNSERAAENDTDFNVVPMPVMDSSTWGWKPGSAFTGSKTSAGGNDSGSWTFDSPRNGWDDFSGGATSTSTTTNDISSKRVSVDSGAADDDEDVDPAATKAKLSAWALTIEKDFQPRLGYCKHLRVGVCVNTNIDYHTPYSEHLNTAMAYRIKQASVRHPYSEHLYVKREAKSVRLSLTEMDQNHFRVLYASHLKARSINDFEYATPPSPTPRSPGTTVPGM